MYRILSVFLIILAAIAIGCDSTTTNSKENQVRSSRSEAQQKPQNLVEPAQPPDMMEIQKLVIQRQPIKNKWVECAEKIARIAHDQQADLVMDLLKNNTLLCMPSDQGVKFLEGATPGKPWIGFVSILPEDQLPSDHWRELANSHNFGAIFAPEAMTIIVRENMPCSPIWKGIILLHEGDHAGHMIYAPYDWHNSTIFSMAERDTHEFQNRIMSIIGGEAYADLIDQEVNRLRNATIKDGGKIGEFIPSRTKYDSQLDVIFGPAESEFERDMRETHVWIHAMFTLIDRDFKGDKERVKTDILYTLYLRDGIIKG